MVMLQGCMELKIRGYIVAGFFILSVSIILLTIANQSTWLAESFHGLAPKSPEQEVQPDVARRDSPNEHAENESVSRIVGRIDSSIVLSLYKSLPASKVKKADGDEYTTASPTEQTMSYETTEPVTTDEVTTAAEEITTQIALKTTTQPKINNNYRPKIVIWARHNFDWTVPELPNGDGGCDISLERNKAESADAVLFFMKRSHPGDAPVRRRPDQVYVWWSMESPWTVKNHYRHGLTEYNNFFNWTMTYRSDSDVLTPMWPVPTMDYFLLRTGRKEDMYDKNLAKNPTISEEDFQTQIKVLMSRKTKFISSVITDCAITKGARNRGALVRDLETQGSVTVDNYGQCAGRPIPLGTSNLLGVLSDYKFFLAFENTLHCRDYLTEKTACNCLMGGCVPVIHGPTKEDTAKLIPKGSYIHLEDFPDLKALGDHLNYLNKNDTAYLEYFSWWKEPGAQTYPRFGFNYGPEFLPRNPKYPKYGPLEVQEDWIEYERFGMYHLCRRLKRGDHKKTTKIIPSLADWFYGTEKRQCYDR